MVCLFFNFASRPVWLEWHEGWERSMAWDLRGKEGTKQGKVSGSGQYVAFVLSEMEVTWV